MRRNTYIVVDLAIAKQMPIMGTRLYNEHELQK